MRKSSQYVIPSTKKCSFVAPYLYDPSNTLSLIHIILMVLFIMVFIKSYSCYLYNPPFFLIIPLVRVVHLLFLWTLFCNPDYICLLNAHKQNRENREKCGQHRNSSKVCCSGNKRFKETGNIVSRVE